MVSVVAPLCCRRDAIVTLGAPLSSSLLSQQASQVKQNAPGDGHALVGHQCAVADQHTHCARLQAHRRQWRRRLHPALHASAR